MRDYRWSFALALDLRSMIPRGPRSSLSSAAFSVSLLSSRAATALRSSARQLPFAVPCLARSNAVLPFLPFDSTSAPASSTQNLHGFQTVVQSCLAQWRLSLQVVLRCDVSGGLPDQKLDCFQMPVLDPQAQRRQSPLVLRLDVGGSLLDQNFHRFQMSVLSRPSRQCMSLVPLTRRQRGLPAAASQFSNVLLEPPYQRQIAHHNFALHPGTVGSILVLTIPLI